MEYKDIVTKFNFDKARIDRNELISCCPLHQDSNPSFSLNLKTGLWICFAGCGQGDFIELVARLYRVSRVEASKIIGNKEIEETDIVKLKNKIKKITENKDIVKEEIKPVYIDEKILSHFDYKDRKYMKKRGFNENILKEFEIGKYNDCITIPIRDENNNLLGVIGRNLDGSHNKYKPIFPKVGLAKGNVLYGLNKVDKKIKSCILVEGNFDVLMGFQCGFRNIVAIQGSNLTKKQEILLLQNFDTIYVATDNDKPGRDACKKITKQLSGKVNIYEFKYFTKRIKDIGEMDTGMIMFGLDSARFIK
jgi:DNA primase